MIQIRLMGTAEEVAAGARVLRRAFAVQRQSQQRPCRDDSATVRVYIDVALRDAAPDTIPATGKGASRRPKRREAPSTTSPAKDTR